MSPVYPSETKRVLVLPLLAIVLVALYATPVSAAAREQLDTPASANEDLELITDALLQSRDLERRTSPRTRATLERNQGAPQIEQFMLEAAISVQAESPGLTADEAVDRVGLMMGASADPVEVSASVVAIALGCTDAPECEQLALDVLQSSQWVAEHHAKQGYRDLHDYVWDQPSEIRAVIEMGCLAVTEWKRRLVDHSYQVNIDDHNGLNIHLVWNPVPDSNGYTVEFSEPITSDAPEWLPSYLGGTVKAALWEICEAEYIAGFREPSPFGHELHFIDG